MDVLDYLQGFPEVLKMDQDRRDVGVLYDLPLILAGLGTKTFLWYKPKDCVFQESLDMCTHPGEEKVNFSMGFTVGRWSCFHRSPPGCCGMEQGEV